MTVKQLKKLLEKLPDNMKVILQRDLEGNGYSPLCGGDTNAVFIPDPESDEDGEVFDLDWSADDACMDESEWKKIKRKPKVLVLYP